VYRIAPPQKVVVVPLGFDLSPFAAARQTKAGRFRAALSVPAEAPLVGFVGRLTKVKNPGLFVEAARLVLARAPEARFCLVGDGELRPEVERQIAALGLADRVRLAGWQRDMPSVYADLDVLTLTSLNEGTPATAIEALAAEVPVVATAVGGVADVVEDGLSGLLVPSGDATALATSISALLSDPGRGQDLARAGQRDVLARFGLERLVSDTESLYQALLAEKGLALTAVHRSPKRP
jgi:glycosyltransferase involved in cell wall biosynthesis